MLSLTHLKYFRDAALLGGITAAAERNRVSTSAVSQAVRNLESHFDTVLLQHRRNRFALTPEGQLLLERSHNLFFASELLHEEMRSKEAKFSGAVSFATQQSIAYHLLPQFMAKIQTEMPKLQVKIKLATTDIVMRWIETQEIEFGLSVDHIEDQDFVSLPVFKGRFVFVESTKNKKTSNPRRFITPGEFTRESRAFRRDYEAKFGVAPEIAMDVKSWGVVKRFAELGMGTGYIPDYLLRSESAKGIREVDVGLPTMPYQISAFYSGRRKTLSKSCQMFLDHLEKFGKTL